MYIVGEALTLQRKDLSCYIIIMAMSMLLYLLTKYYQYCSYLTGDQKLVQGICDDQERKITCIENTFEYPARTEQKRVALSSSTTPTTSPITEKSSTLTSNSLKYFNSDTVTLNDRHFPPICT